MASTRQDSRGAYIYRYERAPRQGGDRGRPGRPHGGARHVAAAAGPVASDEDYYYYYARRRSSWYISVSIPFMILGVLLYFTGGFLFVAAYNGVYPVLKIALKPVEQTVFWWVGPFLFFLGLIVFIVAYASCCKGLRCSKEEPRPTRPIDRSARL